MNLPRISGCRRALLALSLSIFVCTVGAQTSADPSLPRKLCNGPSCPEAVEIPPNYGSDDVCGDSFLTDGQDVYWDYTVPVIDIIRHINTGKRFRPGVFEITKLSYMMQTDDHNDTRDYYQKAKMEYTVTCQNGIKYKDTHEWGIYDHDCNTFWSDCSEHSQDWTIADPPTYDPISLILQTNLGGSKSFRIPMNEIVDKWRGRTVGVPHYYGGVNKLAVPVVLINGFGYDFRAMGAVPKDPAGTEGWRKGYVKDYTQGSLPDVISRAYGLAKGSETINHNGIYFANLGDVEALDSRQAQLWLLDRLGEMLVDQAAGWPLSADMKVDVVCHSSSCLLLREAIAQANSYLPANGVNPVNYIRKIITINAPHMGTGLGRTIPEMAGFPTYDGLPEMLDQINNPNGEQHIVDGSINIDFSKLGYDNCDGLLSAACWLGGEVLDIFASELDFATDIDLRSWEFSVSGSMFGSKRLALEGLTLKTIPGPNGTNDQLIAARKAAIKANQWIAGRPTLTYPKYPSGQYIDIQPFYSDRANDLEVGLAKEISNGVLGNLCGSDGSTQCNVLQDYLQNTARGTLDDALTGKNGPHVTTGDMVSLSLNPTYVTLMTKLRNGWLKYSDMVVEKESQVWNLTEPKYDANNALISQLHPAVTYAMHYAEVPEGSPNRPVLHGPMYAMGVDVPPSKYLEALNKGASQMGRDLFCSLEPGCAQFLGSNRPILYGGPAVKKLLPYLLPNGTIDTKEAYTQVLKVEDDFDLYPQILSGPDAGIVLQDGSGATVAMVRYDPTTGTTIWIKGPDEWSVQVLMPPDKRPQISVERDQGRLQTTLTTQTGSKVTASLGNYAGRTMQVVATGEGLATSQVLFLGTATPVDSVAQNPPLAWGTVRPILQEKGQKEANQSRPWLWMTNTSDVPQKGLTLTYYFTADPARQPVAEMDYPLNLSLRTEHLAGNLWALHVALPEIPSKKAFPDGGMQLRLHYADWTPWVKADDPSIGSWIPNFSEKVVVRDALGRIVWGSVPTGSDTTKMAEPTLPDSVPALPATVQVSWMEGGINESNTIRPVIMVQNGSSQGSLAAGFHVVLKIKASAPFTVLPVLEDWYSPSSSGSEKIAPDGSLVVDWTFGPGALEPGQSVDLGQWGLHFSDWRNWNKPGLTYEISLLDAQGQILLNNAQVIR